MKDGSSLIISILRVEGSYFGLRKALRQIDAIYSYNDHTLWLDLTINSLYEDFDNLQVKQKSGS
jgi:hypothetical protein